MGKTLTKSQQFERDTQRVLGLRPTISSGNKWHDPSDGKHAENHQDVPYRLMVDCKQTDHRGFILYWTVLAGWWRKATQLGHKFALPVRFSKVRGEEPTDWVVVPLDDYAELVHTMRRVTRDYSGLKRSYNLLKQKLVKEKEPTERLELLVALNRLREALDIDD